MHNALYSIFTFGSLSSGDASSSIRHPVTARILRSQEKIYIRRIRNSSVVLGNDATACMKQSTQVSLSDGHKIYNDMYPVYYGSLHIID